MNLLKSLTCAVLLAASIHLNAQSYVEDIYLERVVTGYDQSGAESTWNTDLVVRLSDTVGLNKIYLKVGTDENGYDFLNCTYSLSDATCGGCGEGCSMTDIRFVVHLGEAAIDGQHYYLVELEDMQANRYVQFTKQF